MRASQIKTITVNCKEWFDKVNGNSYFAGEVIVNIGKKSEQVIKIPFQNGYGEYYRYCAFQIVKKQLRTFKTVGMPRQAYEKYNIKTSHSLLPNCTKKELINQ